MCKEPAGWFGSYPMSRDSSGTSWVPDSSPMGGTHVIKDDWVLMAHGYVDLIYDSQQGARGGDKLFSESMLMGGAMHPLGPGKAGMRGMFSLDPAMGKKGYPLLLQTGETADGRTPLIDRQHPHDLFMELAATYEVPFEDKGSAFVYFGLPGEPALGPPVFMHRFSGMDIPEAPITHHWLDSTHITYGVVTAGLIWDRFKVEASGFRGREPNEYRWNLENLRFDSCSTRISFNPTEDLAFQASYGYLNSPEQLHPEVDTNRYSVSVIYNKRLEQGDWQTLVAWGMNDNRPGHTLPALLFESTVNIHERHTFFCRYEFVRKDELFSDEDPRAYDVYGLNKFSGGYIFDFLEVSGIKYGVGGSIGVSVLPGGLREVYGQAPMSYMVFVRAKL